MQEVNLFERHFANLTDPRIERRRLHSLFDIVCITICGVIADCNSFDEIELFGKAHKDWFKRFLELPNGIPSHDTFERVFHRLKPSEFREAFMSWTSEIAEKIEGVVAIDGQTHCGARKPGQKKSLLHVVSAWASETQLS